MVKSLGQGYPISDKPDLVVKSRGGKGGREGRQLLLETDTITHTEGGEARFLPSRLSTLLQAIRASSKYLALVVPRSGTWLSEALLRSQRSWVSAKLSQNTRDRSSEKVRKSTEAKDAWTESPQCLYRSTSPAWVTH